MDLTIQTLQQGLHATLQAVPSKAETLRGIFCAALANGTSILERPLLAEDQFLSLKALRQLGVSVALEKDRLEIEGRGGKFDAPATGPLFLGNSGFGLRCLTALACLVPKGSVTLDGSKEMRRRRPVGELLAALQAQGVAAESLQGNGCPPVRVPSAQPTGGTIPIDCSRSSQFLSGLLMLAPFAAA
ncbi:MAG TPA: 3-phosphoshikimate 1-carboxyvinyltransferase, partial [archaeon]|nr:3-phosphoshikimate 1-carboxyvinyltransferase [archaeon]